MECLRCGIEIDSGKTFCDDCVAQTARYPIKPGTPVLLPVRPASGEKAAARKRERTPSQTIAELRKMIRFLTVVITILSLLLCATAAFLLHTLDNQDDSNRPGRNYTVDTYNTSP